MTNVEQSQFLIERMIRLTQANYDHRFLEEAYIQIAHSWYELDQFDSAIRYRDSAFLYNKISQNELNRAQISLLSSDICYYKGEFDKGLDEAQTAKEIYILHQDSLMIAKVNKEIAVLYRELGSLDEAMTAAFKSLDYFEIKQDSIRIADALRIIASILRLNGNAELGKEYLHRAESFLVNQQYQELFSILLKDLSVQYREEGKLDSSLYVLDRLIKRELQSGALIRAGNTYIAIGNTLMKMDSVEAGLNAFRKAESIYQQLKLDRYISHAMHSIGEVYYAIYQYDSAEVYLKKANRMAKQINYALIYERSLLILYKVYEEQKEYELALKYYLAYDGFVDSIRTEKTKFQIAELETKYQSAQKEKRIIDLQHQHKIEQSRKKTQRIVFIGIIVFILLLLFIIWQKRRGEKQIADAEREKQTLKKEELEKSLEFKSLQLSTHALHMMQKNAMMQELQSKLKSLSKKVSDEDKKLIRSIDSQINQSLLSDNEWELFKKYFEAVNKDFYENLLRINPRLTNYEQRLCALIKLNMNSREMASVLNISPNSVKSARYRLKKHLFLKPEDDLELFIRGL